MLLVLNVIEELTSGLADQELLLSLCLCVLLVTKVVLGPVSSWLGGHHSMRAVFQHHLSLSIPLCQRALPPLAQSEQLSAVIGLACPCDWGHESSERQKGGILTCWASVRKNDKKCIPAKRLRMGPCFLMSPSLPVWV